MKIRLSDFKKMVVQEMRAVGMLPALSENEQLDSVEDKKAKEIEPGDEAQLEKPLDKYKALKIKESKLIKQLIAVRSEIRRSTR